MIGFCYGEVYTMAVVDRVIITVSSSKFVEYTRSEDGQVYPDVHIPYNMKEYMKGGDPILEKTLGYIKEGKSNVTSLESK